MTKYLVIYECAVPSRDYVAEFTDYLKARAAYNTARHDIAYERVGTVRFAELREEVTCLEMQRELGVFAR